MNSYRVIWEVPGVSGDWGWVYGVETENHDLAIDYYNELVDTRIDVLGRTVREVRLEARGDWVELESSKRTEWSE